MPQHEAITRAQVLASINNAGKPMDHIDIYASKEAELKARIAELERENARLNAFIESLRDNSKALAREIYDGIGH